MKPELVYEVPELVELGDAGELTLGMTSFDCTDGCDCSKPGAEEERI